MATMNGIDIASYQESLVPANMTTTKFIIVKATGGKGYKNPCFKKHIEKAIAAGKHVGCYHYAQDISYEGTAQEEADFFVSTVKAYVGKATLWLDLEAGAIALGVKWAKAWLDRVYAKTGVKPGIYMSKGVCNQYDWSSVVKAGYPLWVAQYPNYNATGFILDPWTDSRPFGAWGKPTIFQYTSCGKITGYAGSLDLDLFYGGASAWKAFSAKSNAAAKASAVVKSAVSNASSAAKAIVISRANVAAQIMEHLCTCPEHGYSQPGRYGTSGYCSVKTAAGTIKVKKGDRDCTSATAESWELALQGTPYEGKISRTAWTGNMIDMFVGSGLFSKKPMSFDACRGDVYHVHNSDHQHAAMCTQNDRNADLLAEFSIAETGGIDGQPGDQTGRESSIHAFYDGFECILHYNGKADTTTKQATAKPANTSAATASNAGTKYVVVASPSLNVRTKRSSKSGQVVGSIKSGKTVQLTSLKTNKYGNVWAKIASGTFKGRFVAVKFDGETLAVQAGAKTIEQIAREVIAGKWGNGSARADALKKKGYDAAAVQAKVNELLG